MDTKYLLGKHVKIVKDSIVGSKGQFIGKTGVVTSVGSAKLPIHVTLDGQKYETDFKVSELEVLQ